jgi:Holliday junction resolvasome RuvABC ATP-dependent DNA helicase subunit
MDIFQKIPINNEDVNSLSKSYWRHIENMKMVHEPVLAITIKEGQFDASKVVEYCGENIPLFEFRPKTWNEFISQEEAKERAKTIVKKVKKGLKSHFLVDGIKGHGKTTFCEILARDIDAHLIKRIGKQISVESLVDIVNEINSSDKKNVMLFVDELDTMDSKVIKVLNPIIESFEIAGKRIKPFIFAGATINKHILIKNNPDTLDRIPTHIKFTRYNADEMTTILAQYIDKLYKQETVSVDEIKIIAINSKYNPRTAIGILEELIVEDNINSVLKNCNIVKDGLTKTDIKLLQILNNSNKAIGANSLAMKCGISQDEYLREFEPYLCEYDYINRVPSRIITDKGRALLKELL